MRKNNGFTLIELLIVIVLIGILAAVLVTIINPSEKQNKANDGTIMSMMNKIILSTESFNSAYGRAPNDREFLASLETNTNEAWGTSCTGGVPDSVCLFSVNGINPPTLCDNQGWTGIGTDQCYFKYSTGFPADSSRFRLYVRSVGLADTIFTFDSKSGGRVFGCPLTIADGDDITTVCH